jgi:hypothetical protein
MDNRIRTIANPPILLDCGYPEEPLEGAADFRRLEIMLSRDIVLALMPLLGPFSTPYTVAECSYRTRTSIHAGCDIYPAGQDFGSVNALNYNVSVDYDSRNSQFHFQVAKITYEKFWHAKTAREMVRPANVNWHEFEVEGNRPDFIELAAKMINGQLACYEVVTGEQIPIPMLSGDNDPNF